jgi:hypothetical protein
VLAAGADAFLRVAGAVVAGGADAGPGGNVGLLVAEEDGHELVMPALVKSSRASRGAARRMHDGVLLLVEEIEEGLADLGGGHDGGK